MWGKRRRGVRWWLLVVLLCLLAQDAPEHACAQGGPASHGIVTFLQLTDAHMGTRADYEPIKDAWERNLSMTVQRANRVIRPAAIVHTGDAVTLSDEPSYAVYNDLLSQARMPVLSLPGNHDYGPIENFTTYVGRPNSVLDVGPLCLIAIDSLTINYPWLETQLRQHAPRQRIVLLAHYPLKVPDDLDQHDGDINLSLRLSDANRAHMAALMKSYGVLGWVNGHIHVNYEQVEPISGAVDYSTAPIGERGTYRLFAYDNGVLSSVSVQATQAWPLVLITTPQQHFAGLTPTIISEVHALAYSDAVVQQVQYQVGGGAPVAMSYVGQNLWTAPWAPSFTNDAALTMTVTATDAAGRSASHAIPVLVAGRNAPGNVSIAQPAADSTLAGPVLMSGVAEDADGLQTVRVYVDGARIGEVALSGASSAYQWRWNIEGAQNGTHMLQVAACDVKRQCSWSAPVTFTLESAPADAAPAVALDAPAAGQTLAGTITLRATANDDHGLTRMALRYRAVGSDAWQTLHSVDLPEDGGAGAFPSSWQYTAPLATHALTDGAYELQAVAWDDATYAQGGSQTVAVTVQNTQPMAPVRVTGRIAGPWSDHYQVNGTTDQYTDRIFLGLPYVAGLRFTGLDIPQGALITSAVLNVANYSYEGVFALRIQGEASANPEVYLRTALNARETTQAAVNWRLPNNTPIFGSSPDLKAVIQEIIKRPDWRPGNRLGLLLAATGNGARQIHSYEGNKVRAATLDVTYTLASNMHPPIAADVAFEGSELSTNQVYYWVSTYRDEDGWRDVADAWLLVGDSDLETTGHQLRYESATNRVYVRRQGATAWEGGQQPGMAATLGQEVRLHMANTVAIRDGNTVTVYWAVSFAPEFTGAKSVYTRCTDRQGLESGWIYQGTGNVQTRR